MDPSSAGRRQAGLQGLVHDPPHVWSFETLNLQNIDFLQSRAFLITVPPGEVEPKAPFFIDNFTTSRQKTPEPGSLLLFGVGMAATGLAAVHRRLLHLGPNESCGADDHSVSGSHFLTAGGC
jgi:hypothetical protein